MPQTVESLKSPGRFYLGVDVAPEGPGFAVRLDGRIARSPGGRGLILPTQALARLVAAEWEVQTERIVMAAMPATRLLHTALDGVPGRRDEIAAGIADFAADDLVCYFAEGPSSLVGRQQRVWGPLLEWAQVELDLRLERVVGVVHRDQPPASLDAVASLALRLDDFQLAGLALAAQLFGSAILAHAVLRGRLGGAEAFAAAQLDEAFQAERWGEDVEAAAGRRAMAAEAVMLEAWFAALSQP